MKIMVDEDQMAAYIELREVPEQHVTRYLAQHGLLLFWDGRGTLVGVGVRAVDDEPIEVQGTPWPTMAAWNAPADPEDPQWRGDPRLRRVTGLYFSVTAR